MSEIPYKTDQHGEVFLDMNTFSADMAIWGAELASSLRDWAAAG